MKRVVLITIGLSVLLNAAFTRSADIVVDSTTGLHWQDNTDVGGVSRDWQGAIGYCEALSLGGFSDWRLPNINELSSIVDYTKSNPALDSSFQNITPANFYWSSTTNASTHSYAWSVYFDSGYQHYGAKIINRPFRCVRLGQ